MPRDINEIKKKKNVVGTVFDVSLMRNVYGKGGSYSQFSGKDASRALGPSSLKPEDAVPDWSTLEEMDRRTLNDWHTFFSMYVLLLSTFSPLQRK
jgi:membrane-associated progesterone receptor component